MKTKDKLSTNSATNSQSQSLHLSLKSEVKELPLYGVQFECSCPGKEVAQAFQANPLLPGVILTEHGQFVGIISQRQFLEIMSSPYGLELFLRRSLHSLYSFIHQEVLKINGDVQIVEAARHCLQRTGKLVYEPIVVEVKPEVYRLLDMHQLLLADSQIHQLTCQLLNEKLDEQSQEMKRQIARIASLEPKENKESTENTESIGEIVASIAAEIRTPAYWNNTLDSLYIYCQEMRKMLLAYEVDISHNYSSDTEFTAQGGIDLIGEYLPKTLKTMQTGSARITKVVGGLQILLERIMNIKDGSLQQKCDMES